MKNISISILVVVGYFLLGCDRDKAPHIRLEVQDAFVFENNQNVVVGDTIFFELNFSRYLDEEGFANKLDVFESSGSDSFSYSFNINKFSEETGGFNRIQIDDEFVFAEKGTNIGFRRATADLNQERTAYESRIGLIMVETGNFELDFEFTSLRSVDFLEDKVQLDIRHTFSNGMGKFSFEVSE